MLATVGNGQSGKGFGKGAALSRLLPGAAERLRRSLYVGASESRQPIGLPQPPAVFGPYRAPPLSVSVFMLPREPRPAAGGPAPESRPGAPASPCGPGTP